MSKTRPIAQNSNGFKPFRFLDLPKELRLEVYEWLPIEVKAHHINESIEVPWCPPSTFTVLFASTCVSILATCRQIQQESSAIIQQKLDKMVAMPLRLRTDIVSLQSLSSLSGAFNHLSKYMYQINQTRSGSTELWTHGALLKDMDVSEQLASMVERRARNEEKLRSAHYMRKRLLRLTRTTGSRPTIEIGIVPGKRQRGQPGWADSIRSFSFLFADNLSKFSGHHDALQCRLRVFDDDTARQADLNVFKAFLGMGVLDPNLGNFLRYAQVRIGDDIDGEWKKCWRASVFL